MTLKINYVKREDKVITMGKPVADYYPPGATEPQVRPANVPDPAAKAAEAETVSEEAPAKVEPRKVVETKVAKKK